MTSTARSRGSTSRSADEVSALDKRIIEHLQQDGRRPFTQIAADLGVSEAAVRARTNRLVERGILQVDGVTDPLKLGYQQQAMIGVRCESNRLLEVADAVSSFPEVSYVVVTAGAFDLLIEVVCENKAALLQFLAERPYKAIGYPVLPALYIVLASTIAVVLLIADKTRAQALSGLALVALGVPVYYLWRGAKTSVPS